MTKWLICAALFTSAAAMGEERYQRVEVAEPYVDLRTGAGRGYPVVDIAERGTRLEVLKRRTDWFKVRTPRGREGWVHRTQMENTLTDAGIKKSFRDVLMDDYFARRLEFGYGLGQFEGEPAISVRGAYRVSDNYLIELATVQVFGTFFRSSLYHVDLVAQSARTTRFAPYFALGVGQYETEPKATLVGGTRTDAIAPNVGIGGRWYVTRRFVLRADAKEHVALIGDNRTDSYTEWALGVSVFF